VDAVFTALWGALEGNSKVRVCSSATSSRQRACLPFAGIFLRQYYAPFQIFTVHRCVQMRLAALLLCDVLFQRSKRFRHHLLEKFPDFIEAAFAPGKKLPAPQDFAVQLRELASKLVLEWTNKFGSFYPQPGIAVTYVRPPPHIQQL
jgi:hypothetical protein